jgi:hypothetical protein
MSASRKRQPKSRSGRDGFRSIPGNALVGAATTFILKAPPETSFATSEDLVSVFSVFARKGGVCASYPDMKRAAELFDASEFGKSETALDALCDGVDAEDVTFFRQLVDHYTAQLTVQAMLYGLWAGATLTAEAAGLVKSPASGNMSWTVARNVVKMAIEHGKAGA